ncbi:MAG TPA: thioredoxin family protein [Candidatus Nanoarchaeia archaeon]|nr:thioredoxin family protein [Candidatus Nanoarchaeia archaeon]
MTFMERKKLQFSAYLAAFAITTLIFILGIMLGSYNNNKKLASVDNLEQEIKMSTMGNEIQYLLMSESPCDYVNSTEMAINLGNLGSKLTFMESQLGKDDERVVNLKEYYSLLELRHWLFLNKAKKECNLTYDLVIYFYSNEGDCADCEEQGHVLTYVHKKNPKFNVYSFDVNIGNPALDTLKTRYSVESTPTIVINNNKFEGFTGKEKLFRELNMTETD